MPRLDPAPSKKRRFWLLPLALLALPIALKLLGVKPVNRATTSPDSADASLRTRFYAAPPDQLRGQVLAAVPTLSTYGQAWRVMAEDESNPGVVRCQVPVLVFTDDLVVTIEPHAEGSRVDVTSAARVGQGDMGENARHIRQLLSALDKRSDQLGPSRPEAGAKQRAST